MDVGTSIPLPAYTLDPAYIAKKAEELGFESIWYAEHPAVPVHSASPFPATGGPIPENYSHFSDPYISLARASAVTRTIKLCTGITLVPERNPLLLAKGIAVLDRVSGGRFVFGIGTGWLREETELMGGDFDHRWSQTRESIEVMKELWTQQDPSFQGRFHRFSGMKFSPKPAQNPHVPLIIGGSSRAAIRRAARLGNGWHPSALPLEEFSQKIKYLGEQTKTSGRTSDEIPISVSAAMRGRERHALGTDAEEILQKARSYEELGVQRIVISSNTRDSDQMLPDMEMLAREVLPDRKSVV